MSRHHAAGSLRYLPLLGAFLVGTASAGDVTVVEGWRTTIAVAGDPSPPLFGDFDGDGVDEIVTRSELPWYVAFEPRSVLYVHREGPGAERVVVGTFELQRAGRVQVLRRTNGDALAFMSIGFVNGVQVQEMILLSGVPLVVERRQERGWVEQLLHVGDIDSDGVEDSLEYGYDFTLDQRTLRLAGLFDGMPRWQVPTSFEPGFAVGQLDADPALEVVREQGAPGVIDGATGLSEWTAPGNLLRPLIADVWAGSPGNELIALESSGVTVRARGTFQLLAQLAIGCCAEHRAADMDLDGTAEYVRLDDATARILDVDDQSERVLPLPPNLGLQHWIQDVDSDPLPEIVAFDGNAALGSPVASVIDSTTGEREGVMRGASASVFAIAAGDLDEDGSEELVSILHSVVDAQSRMEVRRATTGELLRAIDIPRVARAPESTATSNIVLAQMDEDDALEIVFSHYGNTIHRLAVLDGITLETQWSRATRDEAQDPILFEHIAVADIDGDSHNEVLAISRESRLHVLDALTGLTEWRSAYLGDGYSLRVAAGQVDADPALEVVAWTGRDLHIFDGVTRQLQQQRNFDPDGGNFFIRFDGGRCIFGVYNSWAQSFHDCTDPGVDRPFDLGNVISVERIEPLPGRDNGYIAIVDQHLVYLDAVGSNRTPLGPMIAETYSQSGVSGIAISQGDAGNWELFIANEAELRQLEVASGYLFEDGFE